MQVDAYRLWHQWQQMHYPRRGLPTDDAARDRLLALDGTLGTVFDRYFRRGARYNSLDASARATLDGCRGDLDCAELSSDASRYFGRLKLLIELVVAESGAEPDEPDFLSATSEGRRTSNSMRSSDIVPR
jgi:hypothetical protein